MINLRTNAAHAMDTEGGILEVDPKNIEIDEDTASQHPELNPGSYVQLRVSDTGDGIPSQMIDRIFDPYFTTKDVDMGTGLGNTVIPNTDPSEALAFFKANPDLIDFVITDMTMPRMTGDRLAQEILKIRSDMPIVICTEYSKRISKERAKEIGIRKYIEKPIEMENLAMSVRDVLDGRSIA